MDRFGRFIIFQLKLFPLSLRRPWRVKQIFEQLDVIGVGTVSVIFLRGTIYRDGRGCSVYQGFSKFGAEGLWDYTNFYSSIYEEKLREPGILTILLDWVILQRADYSFLLFLAGRLWGTIEDVYQSQDWVAIWRPLGRLDFQKKVFFFNSQGIIRVNQWYSWSPMA